MLRSGGFKTGELGGPSPPSHNLRLSDPCPLPSARPPSTQALLNDENPGSPANPVADETYRRSKPDYFRCAAGLLWWGVGHLMPSSVLEEGSAGCSADKAAADVPRTP